MHQLEQVSAQPARRFRALLYGLLLIGLGFAIYVGTVVFAALCHLMPGDFFTTLLHDVIWYTGMPVFAGLLLCALDLFVLLGRRPKRDHVAFEAPDIKQLTVVLTAYNDELSIPAAVRDFASHPLVRRVIVLDNNSADRTAQFAGEAGAEVIIEQSPGYGRCVYRALSEGMKFEDTELTLLCEGDMTFRSYDIDKFMAYIAHAEIVNGTRIVEQLRERETQLTTFMYYGNFFAAKVLEAKHLGEGTFTDVGTTYKLCRNRILRKLLPVLDPSVNLEFNAHFLDTALSHGVRMVECPVTFHQRVGRSKGGNTGNWRAFTVGIRMLTGIILSWKYVTRNK